MHSGSVISKDALLTFRVFGFFFYFFFSRREVGLLKELWDMIDLVESSMAAWRTTSWREINVEEMELHCKRFSREIRSLDKEVRGGGSRETVAHGHVSCLAVSPGVPASPNS